MRSILVMALSAFLGLSGFDTTAAAQSGKTIVGSGRTAQESRKVDPFAEITVGAAFQATVTIGPKPSVTLDVDDNLLAVIETKVADGRLTVNYAANTSTTTKKPQKVAIVVPSLDYLGAQGAAKIVATIEKGKELKLHAEGASSIEVKGLDVEAVEVETSGVGKVTLVGKGTSLEVAASGSSKLFATEATFESAKIAFEGTSQGKLKVTGSIEGQAKGASKVVVEGDPSSRKVKTGGVAKVTF